MVWENEPEDLATGQIWTGGQAQGATAIPPYVTVYFWKRTA